MVVHSGLSLWNVCVFEALLVNWCDLVAFIICFVQILHLLGFEIIMGILNLVHIWHLIFLT